MLPYKSIKYSDPTEPTPSEGGRKRKRVWERVTDGEYQAKGDEGTKRMVRDEQTKMYQLLGMIELIQNVMDGLDRRLKMIPRGVARAHTAKSLITKLAFDVINTAPVEQRKYIRDQIVGIEIMTGIKATMPRDPEATFGQFLNFHQLSVVADAIQDQCVLCTIEDPAEQAKCKYRKLLDVLPVDKVDEDAKGCGWFHSWSL